MYAIYDTNDFRVIAVREEREGIDGADKLAFDLDAEAMFVPLCRLTDALFQFDLCAEDQARLERARA